MIDPIDGTSNFMHKRNMSCISVALLQNKQPEYAFVYNPFADEFFFAQRGQGAFLNGKRIHVSDLSLEDSLVSLGTSPYRTDFRACTLKAISLFLDHSADIRRTGSAAIDLCDVACGRSGAFFERQLSPWDVAAGALIVTEAGGCFDMPLNDSVQFSQPACTMAASPRCFDQAKQIILEACKE